MLIFILQQKREKNQEVVSWEAGKGNRGQRCVVRGIMAIPEGTAPGGRKQKSPWFGFRGFVSGISE